MQTPTCLPSTCAQQSNWVPRYHDEPWVSVHCIDRFQVIVIVVRMSSSDTDRDFWSTSEAVKSNLTWVLLLWTKPSGIGASRGGPRAFPPTWSVGELAMQMGAWLPFDHTLPCWELISWRAKTKSPTSAHGFNPSGDPVEREYVIDVPTLNAWSILRACEVGAEGGQTLFETNWSSYGNWWCLSEQIAFAFTLLLNLKFPFELVIYSSSWLSSHQYGATEPRLTKSETFVRNSTNTEISGPTSFRGSMPVSACSPSSARYLGIQISRAFPARPWDSVEFQWKNVPKKRVAPTINL